MKNRLLGATILVLAFLTPLLSSAKPLRDGQPSEDEFERTLASFPKTDELDLVYTPDDPDVPEVDVPAIAEPVQQAIDSTAAVDTGSRKKNCRPFISNRKASFYANKFVGKKTASGTIFSNKEFTAAHPTLPMGTLLKISNPRTGASVEVVVTDRGPFKCVRTKGKKKLSCVAHPTREVDLSQRAFTALFGTLESGVHSVDVAVCD
ncbi:MAG TPA: septal ring lytic transglycosylase RlpA family protein [Bdellovibrionales bacterium]|jgi:rare lipoprotein A|nr:septal ring lytic transglycosylase RlpA family protein [Bdellovibrionales bacterium]